MINFDPSRIHQSLLNTGLQNKDNPLYQVLKQIIDALKAATFGVNENSLSIQNNSSVTNTTANDGSSNNRMMVSDDGVIIEENYYMIAPKFTDTYAEPVTNGDSVNPELLFDSFGDVVMLTGLPT